MGHAANIRSLISNQTFKTAGDCMKQLESDLKDRSISYEDMEKVKNVTLLLGDELVAEMNTWYGSKELAKRWNGFPCFGQKIFAKTPLTFYQQSLSHLLEADVQAYCKASKSGKGDISKISLDSS